MSRGARIHVDVDNTDCSAVMVQLRQDGDMHVVAMIGRELMKSEQKCTMLERLMLCACWAVKRLSQYVLYLPSCVIVMPRVEKTVYAQTGGLTTRL